MTDRSVSVKLRAEVSDYVRGMDRAASSTKGVTTAAAGAKTSARGMADVQDLAASRTVRATEKIKGAYGGVNTAAAKMGAGVGLVAGLAATSIKGMADEAIAANSDLQEQVSATETLFGKASATVIKFGESAYAIGLSERAALEASNAYGDFFIKIGYTQAAAATLSEDLVRVAGDFASFKNLDPGDVLEKLRSGLAGESEPLRSLGVFLTEDKVKAEGMRLGLADAHGELTEGEKITVRYNLILKEMGNAYGDVSRTANSYANQQRRASAETENAKASLGRSLLPLYTDAATVVSSLAEGVGKLGDKFGGFGAAASHSVSPMGYLADAIRFFKGGADEATTSTDYLADSEKILANSQKYTKQQVQAATQSMQEQVAALDRLLTATQSQFSSEIAYQQSLISIRSAVHDYSDALAKNRDSKKDNNVSSDELKSKQLEIRSAILQAGEAAVRQAEDHAQAAGKTLTASEKYDAFRAALVKLRDQFPGLRGQIDEYIARLKAIPSKKLTKVELQGVSQVKEGIQAIDFLLGTLNGKKATVTVTKTTKDIFLPGGLGDPPAPKKKARGGRIVGAGGPDDDLVPTWLSNGEFVVNAHAARRHGAALERLNRSRSLGDPGLNQSLYAASLMATWSKLDRLDSAAPAHQPWMAINPKAKLDTSQITDRRWVSGRSIAPAQPAGDVYGATAGFRDLVVHAPQPRASAGEIVDAAVFAARAWRL